MEPTTAREPAPGTLVLCEAPDGARFLDVVRAVFTQTEAGVTLGVPPVSYRAAVLTVRSWGPLDKMVALDADHPARRAFDAATARREKLEVALNVGALALRLAEEGNPTPVERALARLR